MTTGDIISNLSIGASIPPIVASALDYILLTEPQTGLSQTGQTIPSTKRDAVHDLGRGGSVQLVPTLYAFRCSRESAVFGQVCLNVELGGTNNRVTNNFHSLLSAVMLAFGIWDMETVIWELVERVYCAPLRESYLASAPSKEYNRPRGPFCFLPFPSERSNLAWAVNCTSRSSCLDGHHSSNYVVLGHHGGALQFLMSQAFCIMIESIALVLGSQMGSHNFFWRIIVSLFIISGGQSPGLIFNNGVPMTQLRVVDISA
ncbi:hypothetical protein IW262DRAFT_1300996 [Armillaria fumosa]|nr:hypothetical protein IW262DRAFT_1300996 [Armillaria fumosa]